MNSTEAPAGTRGDIGTYVAAVRAALADLPAATRDELTQDLPDHLLEVAAENTGPLDERLGPPARYAAELRAAAGLPEPRDAQAVPARMPLSTRLNLRLGRLIGYETFGQFAADLRPGWWVLRGTLAGLVLAALVFRGRMTDLHFWILGAPFVSVARFLIALSMVAACVCAGVIASVRLGRSAPHPTRRVMIILADLALLLAMLYLLRDPIRFLAGVDVPDLLYRIFG